MTYPWLGSRSIKHFGTCLLSILLYLFASNVLASQIVIGIDADMSKVAAEGGIAIQQGAQIAIDEINESGGLLGKKLMLQIKDHRGNPARGLDNMKQFAEMDNLVAVLSGVHTPVALKQLGVVHQHNINFLIPWAAGTPIVDNGRDPNFVFRVSVRDQYAGGFLMNEAKRAGHQKVALFLERTGWGRSNDNSMSEAAISHSMDIVSKAWFHWGQKSIQMELERAINEGATAILLVANAPEGAMIAQAVSKIDQDIRPAIFSHWGITGGAFLEKAGIETVRSLDLRFLQSFSFVNAYDKKISDAVLQKLSAQVDKPLLPDEVVAAVGLAHAYDLVHLLALAIKQSQSIDRATIRDNLEKIDEYKGLVKHYHRPFRSDWHEGLGAEDLFLGKFNDKGFVVPVP